MATSLFKSVRVIDPSGPWNHQKVDLLVVNGHLHSIDLSIPAPPQASVYQIDGLHVSSGWLDMGCTLQEPGFEHKEDIKSLAKAGAKGGFTDLAPIPHTSPSIHSKEGIAFIKGASADLLPTFHPIAAATTDAEGKQITEMIDLHHAGAIAFSDGKPVKYDTAILKTALLYLQSINGLLITYAQDAGLRKGGQMHEGHVSTLLGMKGFPKVAEEMGITRDLSILKYTGGKIHFSTLSTAKGIDLVRKAKAAGLRVTADVAAHQLAFTDAMLQTFNTSFKVDPPFRSTKDIEAIWEGLADGTIDAVTSAHTPQDVESKELEFDLADFGAIGLETAFASLRTHKPDSTSLDQIIHLLTNGPRKVLGLEEMHIVAGSPAKLTFFLPDEQFVFMQKDISSKSKNSPFIGQQLTGKVVGVINGTQESFSIS